MGSKLIKKININNINNLNNNKILQDLNNNNKIHKTSIFIIKDQIKIYLMKSNHKMIHYNKIIAKIVNFNPFKNNRTNKNKV